MTQELINTNHIQQVKKLDGEYSGAMDGLFSPDKYSKIKNFDAGSVFLYMFRRFGYPRFGWDGQKTLVKWILTTDMDGVLLEVQPNVTGAGTFGYLLRDDIDRACMEEENKPWDEWHSECRAWIKAEHGIEIIHMFYEPDTELLKRVFAVWSKDKQDSEFGGADDMSKQFYVDQDDIRSEYVKMYKENHPMPKTVEVMGRSKESIMRRCQIALHGAIEDLSIPVMIRDVTITIEGERVALEDNMEVIECSKMAGVGVGNLLDNRM